MERPFQGANGDKIDYPSGTVERTSSRTEGKGMAISREGDEQSVLIEVIEQPSSGVNG